ncbi:MAG: sigma 54-interacting transcriptional regulator [Phycisphaerae bacterium]|nr:sigma 54-interacting transcriptional regulator [Phycisphaerae bacterium]
MSKSQPEHQVLDGGDFEAVLDSLDEGIVTLDDHGNVIGINRAACELLDISKAEALKHGCPCLLGEEICAPGSRLRESISKRQPIRFDEVNLEMNAEHRKVFTMRSVVFRAGERRTGGGVVIFSDITELVNLRRDLGTRYRLHNIIGKSKAIQDVFELIEQVADSDATVLIEGETGTGKELVAHAIHHLGPRAAGPFVAVNCSALPESLLESELFGHTRGAFTGALRDKRGRFEAASGGTIFLDEIGDISANIQVKLLRVLQERTIERVGDEQPLAVDIRVIAATNRPLAELVSSGQFRQDLYYRLRVVPIRLPMLSGRRDDIPLLAQHFVERFREQTGRAIDGIDEEALALMLDHRWPGNVRELENAVEHAFVKARRGLIRPAHLPLELRQGESGGVESPAHDAPVRSRGRGRADLSPERVREVLTATGWNVAKAARRLHISRTTLYKRMAEFNLDQKGGRSSR